MPYRPKVPCKQPGCAALVEPGKQYCEKHLPLHLEVTRSAGKRGYGSRWDNIFAWFGKKMNGESEKRLQEVEKQVADMWINNHRQCILTFARECRSDISHSSDEWSNVLNVAEEYEQYVREKHITNGIIHQDTQYLRKLYQELSMEHKF